MIFEPSGMAAPSPEEVRFEARELVQRSGWGLPLIDRLRKVADPYWREAITRCLMERWNELVRDKDEQTYYYDSDGDVRYCWMDAEYDFSRIIRRCTAEQVEQEQSLTKKTTHTMQPFQPLPPMQPTRNNRYNQYNNYGTINQIGTQNFNYGTIYNAPVTINNHYASAPAAEPAQAATDFVQPEEERHFGLLTAQCIREGKAQAVEAELRSAASGSAQKLVQCIRTNEALGYIDTKNLNSQALYDELNAYFGLKYKYQNFAKYRRD